MRYLLGLIGFLFFISCSDTANSNVSNNQVIGKEFKRVTETRSLTQSTNKNAQQLKQQQKCKIDGEVLEGNELWLKDHGQLVCIIADSSTYEASYGMSHRILEVYNTYTCSLDLKMTLPVNLSPDFPYFLADINYNNDSKIVAVKAAKTIYCLDLETKRILPILIPAFKNKREEVDASSGNIIRLELWEDFLIGFVQDKGTFVFDLSTKNGAKPVLPFAEYKVSDTRFNSLFLLASDDRKYQAILPAYDWEEEVFTINPIFKTPVPINTDVQKSALDNQYLVLRHTNNKNALLVDMKARKNKSLPNELVGKTTKEILAWVKG